MAVCSFLCFCRLFRTAEAAVYMFSMKRCPPGIWPSHKRYRAPLRDVGCSFPRAACSRVPWEVGGFWERVWAMWCGMEHRPGEPSPALPCAVHAVLCSQAQALGQAGWEPLCRVSVVFFEGAPHLSAAVRMEQRHPLLSGAGAG